MKTDAKLKEQIEIIDKFIKTQPAMPKAKATAAPAVDLTEKKYFIQRKYCFGNIGGTSFKTGQKEKAVEMLKKLIWKFPQKAYFAAQIQELKK